MAIDKDPLIIKNFKGIKRIEENTAITYVMHSETPFDYAFEAKNLNFLQLGGFETRRGVDEYDNTYKAGALSRVPRQFWKINDLNDSQQIDRWLLLYWDATTSTGYLYDNKAAVPTTAIFSLAGMQYAFVLNAFGKVYITPWSAFATPLNAATVYVYDGTTVRATKAAAPVVGAFAVAAAAGGNCTPGVHFATVLFETDTGYISVPPTAHVAAPLTVTTTAANATMSFTGIPVGGAGTGVVKRHIIVTKIVVNNNGQGLLGYEPFFAVTLNDNTTTVATFTRPDSALVDTAKDYLVDSVSIPPCISLAVYNGRMVYIGPRVDTNRVLYKILVSPVDRPEQVETTLTAITPTLNTLATRSTITIGTAFSGKPHIAQEYNKVLYVFKEDSTWGIVEDPTTDPADWIPDQIDGGKGAFPFGIASVSDNPSALSDGALIVAGDHGVALFDGHFSQDNLAENVLDTIGVTNFNWVKILVDPVRKLIFLKPSQGFDGNLYVGNYFNGLNSDRIRWSKWVFPSILAGAIDGTFVADVNLRAPKTTGTRGVVTVFDTHYPLLTLLFSNSAGVVGNNQVTIMSETNGLTDFRAYSAVDEEYPLWELETGYTPNKFGELYTFGPAHIRLNVYFVIPASNPDAVSNGNVTVGHYGLDSVDLTNLPALSPGNIPTKYFSLLMNRVQEQIRFRIGGQNHTMVSMFGVSITKRGDERPR